MDGWFISEFFPKVEKHLKGLKMAVRAILVEMMHPPEGLVCNRHKMFFFHHMWPVYYNWWTKESSSICVSYRTILSGIPPKKMDLEGSELVHVLKSIHIKSAIYLGQIFWRRFTITIVKSWREAWYGVQEAVEKRLDDNSQRRNMHNYLRQMTV